MGRASYGNGKALDVEMLTEFVAKHCGLPYYKIDPLKTDAAKVAETMGAPYAQRHGILPVQVTATEVVIAVKEPWIDEWVGEVERQARRPVHAWPRPQGRARGGLRTTHVEALTCPCLRRLRA